MRSRLTTAQEEKAAAGIRGEQSVAAGLGRALDDDWILFQGYRNRRGEIDGLLVGPRGLFAIEVKNHNGTVDIRGDDWSSVKYGRRGDVLRERAPMGDRRGRSPSQQLSEPTGQLADWLRIRGQQVTPVLIVALVHPNARIGQVRSPTVHVVTSVQALLKRVEQSPATLPGRQRAQVEDLIRRDHEHWAGRASR